MKKQTKSILPIFAIAALALTTFSVTAEANNIRFNPGRGKLAYLKQAGNFNTFLTAAKLTGLDKVVGQDDYTLFVPTDDAFAKIPQATLDFLIANPAILTDVLLYHIVEGKKNSTVLAGAGIWETVLGDPLSVRVGDDGVFINASKVEHADIRFPKAVVHVIDTVLTVPDVGGEFDIASFLKTDGRFTTLLTALNATGLDQVLLDSQDITLFAPTDDAFAKLGNATIQSLLADPAALTDILKYHVSGNKLNAATLLTQGSADTLLNQKVKITNIGGQVLINSSKLLDADIRLPEVIIHSIDSVLIP